VCYNDDSDSKTDKNGWLLAKYTHTHTLSLYPDHQSDRYKLTAEGDTESTDFCIDETLQ